MLFSKQFLVPPPNLVDDENFPNVTHLAYASTEPYNHHTPDEVFPFFPFIEVLCYMGWVKVAESLLNPFGGKEFISTSIQ